MPQAATNRALEENTPAPAGEATPPSRDGRSLLKALADFAQQHLWKGVVGLMTSAGVAGFFLSPVKDWAYHKLWHEHAVLRCYVVQQEVSVNDSFELDLTVIPQGITVSPGVIEVQYPADKLVPVKPLGLLPTEAITDTKIVAQMSFRTLAHGPVAIDIYFNTKYGKYRVSQQVLVRESDPNHHPSKENFSGTWNMILGNARGELHLEDNNGSIGGHYELDNGDLGEIKGVRGPAALRVLMTNKRGEQFAVECKLNISDIFIELRGDFADIHAPRLKQDFYGSSRL